MIGERGGKGRVFDSGKSFGSGLELLVGTEPARGRIRGAQGKGNGDMGSSSRIIECTYSKYKKARRDGLTGTEEGWGK